MKKVFAMRRPRCIFAVRGFGIFASAAMLCFAATLALSSCGDGRTDAAGSGEDEKTEMRGFFISVDQKNRTDCVSTKLDLFAEKGGLTPGLTNVRLDSRHVDYRKLNFPHTGVRVKRSAANPETMATSYVSSHIDGIIDRPGLFFLVASPENETADKTIYTGFWTGYPYRPEQNYKPVVICPYVFAPVDTEGLKDIPDGSCGTGDGVHPKLAKYLTKGDGSLRSCHRLWSWEDAPDGGPRARVLNPVPND